MMRYTILEYIAAAGLIGAVLVKLAPSGRSHPFRW
jgi:hypothetical protein